MPLPPLSVYVHAPWCVRKCPYCDFNSHALAGEVPADAWVAGIRRDLAEQLAEAEGREIQSVFFGGGTPSLLPARAIGAVLETLDLHLPLAADLEVTLEANPGTAEADRFADYRAAGINRLSLGAQSFDDSALQRLGRIHSSAEAIQAMRWARQAGFERINLDLMHGLPDQTQAAAMADLDQALALQPEHLSWYQLTIEPNTAFYNAPPTLPLEDLLDDIETEGLKRLAAAGLQRYEISAYARPGEACRHNLNYWSFGDYLGLGPGAHGKLSQRLADGTLQVTRSRRTRAPTDWLPPAGQGKLHLDAPLPAADLAAEFMLNALRLLDGVPEPMFQERTGLPLTVLQPALDDLRAEGLITTARLAPTPLGVRFLNRVIGRFLEQAEGQGPPGLF